MIENKIPTTVWQVGGNAKSRCHLGVPKEDNLRYSYVNILKLEKCGPKGECVNNNH